MKNSRPIFLAGLTLVLAALAAYHNTMGVPFIFDDGPSILENPSITHLWPLSGPLSPPPGEGFTVSGRPLLNLSLAVNYAISGTDVWSYHALNLLIHTLAGLTLFGLVRRTLLLEAVGWALCPEGLTNAAGNRGVKPLLQQDALFIAFTVALLWTLHPLQTEAVTYVVQRAESLMGLCYLLALYAFARSADSLRPKAWRAVAIAACLLGAGCKEVIVTAPVIILLYDRTFVAGGFREAWRRRRWFYAGLMATWLPVGWLVLATGGNRGGTFVLTLAACRDFWLTQFEAITRYLQLSVWPRPLVFDYGVFKPSHFSDVAPYALVVLSLLAVTGYALWKKPVAGFLGACFFIILAPTSVVPGLIQVIVEHRMYLPLAAVLALVTGGGLAWLGRRGRVLFLALALVAGWLTERRNADYASEFKLWNDSVQKRPGSALAQCGLGSAYFRIGNLPEAVRHFQLSLQLDPQPARTHYNLGLALDKSGRWEEAVASYTEAVRLQPDHAPARAGLGGALMKLGHMKEAVKHLHIALAIAPGLVEADNSLGLALVALGQLPEAVAAYENALALMPDLADVHYNLAQALVVAGRGDDALSQYQEAVRLKPAHAEARLNLGIMLAQRNRLDEALVQLREAARLQPKSAEAHANLGIALAETGRVTEAVGSYEAALRLRPDYAVAHYNLGNALIQLQRWPEAKRHFAEAVRLAPDFTAAREMLERMQDVP